MIRGLALAASLLLGGCGGTVWIPVIAAGLGYAASANDLAGKIIAKEEAPAAPEQAEHPPLDGTWMPP